MSISITEVAKGIALKIDGAICTVDDFNHVKPAKGSSFVRIRLRNLKTNLVVERTFRSAETLDDVPLEERKMQYLYCSGDKYHFMDQTTFEEHTLSADQMGDITKYLLENMELLGYVHEDRVLKLELPNFIVAKVVETEPGIKGDSSRAGTKPGKIETGAAILVPLFVEAGDEVKIDTRNGQYVERVKR